MSPVMTGFIKALSRVCVCVCVCVVCVSVCLSDKLPSIIFYSESFAVTFYYSPANNRGRRSLFLFGLFIHVHVIITIRTRTTDYNNIDWNIEHC